MISEIGSDFWISQRDILHTKKIITPELFNIKGTDYSWLSTGRSAIKLVLKNIELFNPEISKIAMLPSYTCESVFEPFLDLEYNVFTYSSLENLTFDYDKLYDFVLDKRPSVFLFHRYFGMDTFKNAQQFIDDIKKLGVIVIEDKTQCLYSAVQEYSVDYYVGSIRKWFGVPAGGFLVSTNGKIFNKPLKTDEELEEKKLEACILKHDFLFNHKGDKQNFLDKFAFSENLLDKRKQIFLIGEASYALQSELNIEELKSKRRQNYILISKRVENLKFLKVLYDNIEEGEVPLYCCIQTKYRETIQKALREHSVYAPIIWPKPKYLSNLSKIDEMLYRELLCIPIDQRYGKDEMEYIADILCNLDIK